jgi:hypothetical protein
MTAEQTQRWNRAEEETMAKQTMWPAPSTGGGVLGKLMGWLITLALVFLLIHNPVQFAGWVKTAVQFFQSAIVAIVQFLQALSA